MPTNYEGKTVNSKKGGKLLDTCLSFLVCRFLFLVCRFSFTNKEYKFNNLV